MLQIYTHTNVLAVIAPKHPQTLALRAPKQLSSLQLWIHIPTSNIKHEATIFASCGHGTSWWVAKGISGTSPQNLLLRVFAHVEAP